MPQISLSAHETSKSSQGPGAVLSAVATIAGSMLGRIGGVLASQFALSTMSNDFNPLKGAEQMLTRDGLKSTAINVASASIMGSAPDFSAPISEIAKYSAQKALLDTSLRVTIGGEEIEKAVKDGAVNFVGNVVGQVGANELTRMYTGTLPNGMHDLNGPTLNSVTHEIAQVGLGAVVGGIKGDAVAGALGTATARVVANVTDGEAREIYDRVDDIAQAQGISRDSQVYQDLISKELQPAMILGKIGGAVAVGLADRDVGVGLDVASNTLEHSFLPMMVDRIQQMAPAPQSYQESPTPRFVEIEDEDFDQPRAKGKNPAPEAEQSPMDRRDAVREEENVTHFNFTDEAAEFREQIWHLSKEEPRGRSQERDIESRAKYKAGDSPTRAKQKKYLEEAKRAEQEQADYYSNHQNPLVRGMYYFSQAVTQDEGVSQSECLQQVSECWWWFWKRHF